MNETAANAYLRSKVLTAKPEELRLMLYDGALRFIRQGRDALVRKDYESVFRCFTDAKNIVLEFISALDRSRDPELCEQLSALYTFMYRRLVDAGTERDPAAADEVIELLEFDRQTWLLLMNELAQERTHGVAAPQEASQPAGGQLSVQG